MLAIGNGVEGLWVTGPGLPERDAWALEGGSAEDSPPVLEQNSNAAGSWPWDGELCTQASPSLDESRTLARDRRAALYITNAQLKWVHWHQGGGM